jgi:hypothetical protein
VSSLGILSVHSLLAESGNCGQRWPVGSQFTEVPVIYPQRRSWLWYVVVAVLVLFVIKDPSGAAYLAHAGLALLSDIASGLAGLVGSN